MTLIIKNLVKVATLPAISIAPGLTFSSPDFLMPDSSKNILIELDGTAWSAGSTITIVIYLSYDGGLTWESARGTYPKSFLIGGKCSIGIYPLAVANRRIKTDVSHDAAVAVTLVGTVWRE